MSSTADLIRDSLLELAVQDPIDPTDPALLELGRVRYNSLVDLLNAQQIGTYELTFPTFTFTPLLSPHTIGPTGTFVVTQRPVAIIGANVLLSSGTDLTRTPINPRNYQWWLAQPSPNITSGLPTDLYYETAWPNGKIYFWPTPTIAYDVELLVRLVLGQVTSAALTTDLSLPPALYRTLMLMLAEDLSGPLSQQWSPSQAKKKQDACSAYFANNNAPIRIQTRDSGMPGRSNGSGYFNWRARQIS